MGESGKKGSWRLAKELLRVGGGRRRCALRVLIVNAHGDDASAGGAERAVGELTDQLAAQGIDVAYLQAFPSRVAGRDIERTVLHDTDWRDDEARRVRNHLGAVLAPAGARLERLLAQARADLVHTHNLPGIDTGVWEAARRLGLPVVHTIWDYYLLCPRVSLTRRDGRPCRPSPFLCGMRTRRLARWGPAVSHVIGCSQHVIDVHQHVFDAASFHVLRNPIVAPARPARPPRQHPTVLGYIGSLDRVKGVDLLLQAAPRLEELGIVLRLAGDGRLRAEAARATEAGRNVQWVGAVLGDAKQRFLEECDAGIVPSVWAEPGGPTFTMAEWLAAGRPVLVSSRGGLGEVAGVYPGSVPLEPTVRGIVEAVTDLRRPGRWSDLVAAAQPIEGQGPEAWAARHVGLYRAAIR
jgi:glycosyltransferase involved in cell wall biosynthesis